MTTQNEMMILENAVIGDLEIYGIQLTGDLEMTENRIAELNEEILWLKANLKAAEKAKELWKDDALDRKKKATDSSRTETLVRNILDETDPEDDDENMGELRQILWNASDTDKQTEAEGYDKDKVEPIPF